MSTGTRIATFVVGLAVVFGLAVYVGRAAGPDVTDEVAAEEHEGMGGSDSHEGDDEHAGHEPAYTLELARPEVDPGDDKRVAFTIVGADGEPLRDYDVVHEKRLHLIVVGTPALTSFQHVHPTMSADGRWTARLDLAPGTYEVYADATTAGENFVATAPLVVRGHHPRPESVPAATVLERTGPYAVAMTRVDDQVTFTISRHGKPVTDIEPYLGANGHLVVIEARKFEYLHAHPLAGPAGPQVSFEVADSSGAHRLFLEFKHDGAVRRVAFTVGAVQGAGAAEDDHAEEGDGHEH
ncbi:hypothetical protein [Nocardioides sp. Soil796]|uniref:hypothetical protein n=1 Tax=Nocardioides sp. Soil796 TaxID=1736412 RepID=UPI00070D48B7|nr:hypothetical protein [Nocardioides sp. Soil796]KRF13083.1 hypothetical protein ASH02_16490 [Nocardioides sp. Soil796]